MSYSGAPIAAEDKSLRRSSSSRFERGAQHQSPGSKVEQSHEVFEDELAAPSSLRQFQDEVGVVEENTSYRDTRSRKRRSRRSINAAQKNLFSGATPNNLCHCLLVAILAQVLIVAVLLIVYILLSNGSQSQNQNDITTISPINYSNPYVEPIYLAPPPEDIHHLCTMDTIITPAGRQACQAVCSRATCCSLAYINAKSCWNNNVDVCQAYGEACAVLEPLQPTSANKGQDSPQKEYITTVMPNALVLWGRDYLLKAAPDQLSGFCQAAAFWGEDMMNSEEVAGAAMTCHEICNSARCCWDRTLTNAADRCWTHPGCRPYEEACSGSSLASQSTTLASSSIVSTSEAGRPVLQEAPWNITNYCQPDRIETSVHELLACQEMCLPAECCWNSASRDDCAAISNTDKCDAYKSTCGVLIGLVAPQSSESTAQGTLTVAPTIPTKDITSENTNAEPATNETQQGYTKEIIRGACLNHDNSIAAASGRVSLCEQVCQPGSCCFPQSNNQDGGSVGSDIDSCPAYLPDDYCDKFASCSVIFTPSLTTREQTQQACSNLSDLSDCVKICARATCCYTNNPWRVCAATSIGNMICDDFLSCEILYQGLGTAVDAPEASDRNGNGRRLRAGVPSGS